jgi:hypothetical protein
VERKRSVAAFGLLAVLLVSSCSEDSDGAMNNVNTDPLPTSAAADGALLCDFVPEPAVQVALGRDTLSGQGSINRRDNGSVSTGQCRIFAEGAADPAVEVTVLAAHSEEGTRVFQVLADEDPDYVFPEALGPGYGFVKDRFVGENGVEGRGGATTRVLWGDNVVQVAINDQAEGRDAMADAVALTQQIAQVLELPKEPSRPYPTP